MTTNALRVTPIECAHIQAEGKTGWPWFALRVKSNYERMTATALRAQGYEELVPTFSRFANGRGSQKVAAIPLFRGYVFCQFNVRKRLPILMTPGVLHIVGIGKEPVPIDREEMSSIVKIAQCKRTAEPHVFLPAGTRVRVTSGPLMGARGIIAASRLGTRLIASLTLLQRSIAVEINPDWIEEE